MCCSRPSPWRSRASHTPQRPLATHPHLAARTTLTLRRPHASYYRCVATNKYGMPEVVIDGKTGYVFPSGDVDALADAIVKIGGVSAEEQAKMAAAGKEMVFAEHDKVKQFEKILEIIKERAKQVAATR